MVRNRLDRGVLALCHASTRADLGPHRSGRAGPDSTNTTDTNDSGNSGFPDAVVDSHDSVFFIANDLQGRRVATFRGTDTYAKETFIWHLPGASGPHWQGGPLLRDRNAALYANPEKWDSEAAGATRGERLYYNTDFRGNVVALIYADGTLAEQDRYSATGVPFGIPLGDVTADGVVDAKSTGSADYDVITTIAGGAYQVRADLDLDGDVDTADRAIAVGMDGNTLGARLLCSAQVAQTVHSTTTVSAAGTVGIVFGATGPGSPALGSIFLGIAGLGVSGLVPPGVPPCLAPYFQMDPSLIWYWAEAAAACGKVPIVFVGCGPCGDGDGEVILPRYLWNPEVQICIDVRPSRPNRISVREAIIHELVHARQACSTYGYGQSNRCFNRDRWNQRENQICSELEAYCSEEWTNRSRQPFCANGRPVWLWRRHVCQESCLSPPGGPKDTPAWYDCVSDCVRIFMNCDCGTYLPPGPARWP